VTDSHSSQGWADTYSARQDVERQFGDFGHLDIVKRSEDVVAQFVQPGCSLLEVGAHDRSLLESSKVLRARDESLTPPVEYYSCDIDETHHHDFRHLDEINRDFDLVVAFHVLEHIPAHQLGHFIDGLFRACKPGGKVVAAVPNVFCPGEYFRDSWHVTPLSPQELGGWFVQAGFKVQAIHRVFNAPFPARPIKRLLTWLVFRHFQIDCAPGICLVANRPIVTSG
jgi:SAM-dependent methyltransferase